MTKKKMVKSKAIDLSSNAPKSHRPFVEKCKENIFASQKKASIAVNSELIKLYWSIGKNLTERQEQEGWEIKTFEKLAHDIQNAFPQIEGFSVRNIFRMMEFYQSYRTMAQTESQLERLSIFNLPWGHNIILLQGLKDPETRLWYASKTIENGWGRKDLQRWIEAKLHKCEGKQC